MAVQIGSSTEFSTWAVCRTAIGNNADGRAGAGGGTHNQVWSAGFRTTEGNGFVRCDPIAAIVVQYCYVVFDDFAYTFILQHATSNIVMDEQEAKELIGETVTTTSGNFAIIADYLTAGGQAVSPSTGGFNPITAIGKLTAF